MLYLAAMADAGANVATIQCRMAANSHADQLAGHKPSPTIDRMVPATEGESS